MERVGLIPNPTKEHAIKVVKEVMAWLEEHNVEYLIEQNSARLVGEVARSSSYQEMVGKVDLVIVFGGDGTFLNTARTFATAEIPILGVNLGSLGFLTDIELDQLNNALEDLVAEKFELEERMMIEAEVIRDGKSINRVIAINDVVITKGSFARLIELKTYIDNEYLTTYPADGLIIACPTGSTAYSLSAGGPIVNPNLNSLVVTPICPHTLHARSIVTSEDEVVRIIVEADHEDVMLTVDGQEGLKLISGDEVLIKASNLVTNLVKLEDYNFYKILRTRLQRSDF
ncbi:MULTISPECIES: NAD(+)/NADH kinase [unclassified Candidatus Frackibacter]|uniref:NAD(+)/NADH kinase n=1 Tax=unclassified Candidatus Frackibacter TaxID=2648818 RepID=UPI0007934021|nr:MULTISPECIES: NAD(+)/NADH kinase [unclassified Candidatus Frackibacter]KXS42022.1 MAG: NAD+ kinase [Candidatus Frackibacter sp. T328-2]SDC02628.1 NAD+ kinase [Candidatus Frackibacter sp. WG11]SEM69658.1 NAD+ kinase [Candidatus Frackibacter sp. WG12]SFL80898.1 NAD+ kinase [Candidatus Frackibacter sp. WG13]